MAKRLIAITIVILLGLGSASSFAGGGAEETQVQTQKSMFQLLADGISGKDQSGQNINTTALFQRSSDYIQSTFPDQKPKSLRGNPDELARRRGAR